MKTLRVGVIGAGMMGRQHVEAARRIPGVEVVALADANAALAARTCEELCIPGCFADYRQMLDEAAPDAVHNCTPNNLHFEINRELLRRGVNVYCEKPLANTSAETAELCALAEAAGVKAGVNFNYRQNAMVREMHERAHRVDDDPAENWGRTYLVRGHYIQDWMMYDSDYNWRCDPAVGGPSRTVADVGSHWFDTVQFITGKRIVRVNAELATVLPQRKRFAAQGATFAGQTGGAYELVDIGTEDAAFVMMEFEDGVKGIVTLSQVTGGHKNDLEISVDGSNYSMTWRQEEADKLWIGARPFGTIQKHAGPEMLQGDAVRYATLPSGHPVGWHDALRNGIREFYAAVRGGAADNYATFRDGDQVVRIVEACLKSSREKKWADVEVPR